MLYRIKTGRYVNHLCNDVEKQQGKILVKLVNRPEIQLWANPEDLKPLGKDGENQFSMLSVGQTVYTDIDNKLVSACVSLISEKQDYVRLVLKEGSKSGLCVIRRNMNRIQIIPKETREYDLYLDDHIVGNYKTLPELKLTIMQYSVKDIEKMSYVERIIRVNSPRPVKVNFSVEL